MHHEQVNEGFGCAEFYHASLSEINTIKSLILHRTEFDECFESKYYYSNNPVESNGIPQFKEPVEVLYLDLEKLIDECNFTKEDKKFIQDAMLGKQNYYKVIKEKDENGILRFKEEIYDEELYKQFENKLNDICKKIKEQNDYNWITWVEISGQVKIPDDAKYKRCSKCGKDLRLNENNFNKRADNYGDGYRPECKKCRNK